ncbi:MAG: NitT/TauT family transport system permease protein [Solirubrobacteraceae bacterium]
MRTTPVAVATNMAEEPTPDTELAASSQRAHLGAVKRARRRATIVVRSSQALLVVVAMLAWELGTRAGVFNSFFVGSPSIEARLLGDKLSSDLIPAAALTLGETAVGFAIGNLVGISIGLLLWYWPTLARVLDPFLVALGAIPILALAPLLIVWFGTGFSSKVILAALSCVLVALTQAYRGARSVDGDLIRLMESFGARKPVIFRKMVLPSAASSVAAALKLNIGFALIGAVIGEFISSDQGLGHIILVAGANFNLPLVILGVLCLSFLAIVMNLAVGALERYLLRWETAPRNDVRWQG